MKNAPLSGNVCGLLRSWSQSSQVSNLDQLGRVRCLSSFDCSKETNPVVKSLVVVGLDPYGPYSLCTHASARLANRSATLTSKLGGTAALAAATTFVTKTKRAAHTVDFIAAATLIEMSAG